MSNIEKIISEVDSSMAMEGLPLTGEDKDRLRMYLRDSSVLDRLIEDIITKYTVVNTNMIHRHHS